MPGLLETGKSESESERYLHERHRACGIDDDDVEDALNDGT